MAPTSTSPAPTRRETDSLGAVDVPADRYWGAQTQRSLANFRIGGHRFPRAVIRGFGVVGGVRPRQPRAGLLARLRR
jgi:fumarate hydratase class II